MFFLLLMVFHLAVQPDIGNKQKLNEKLWDAVATAVVKNHLLLIVNVYVSFSHFIALNSFWYWCNDADDYYDDDDDGINYY